MELGEEAANHVVNVLRLKEGDAIVVFNGGDGAWKQPQPFILFALLSRPAIARRLRE